MALLFYFHKRTLGYTSGPSTLMVNHNSMVKVDKTDYEGIAIIVTTCSMFALWSVVSVAVPTLGVLA